MDLETIRAASVKDLADKYGDLNARAKSIETEQDQIKAECIRRGLKGPQRGDAFIVTISEASQVRVDTKSMKEDAETDKKLAKILAKYSKSSESLRFLVKPAPSQIEGAAE